MPGRGTRELQIRHVGAGDQEHDRDGAEHDENWCANRPDQLIGKRLHVRANAGVGYGIPSCETPRNGVEIRLRAIDAHVALQPTYDEYAGTAPQLEVTGVRIVADRHP